MYRTPLVFIFDCYKFHFIYAPCFQQYGLSLMCNTELET